MTDHGGDRRPGFGVDSEALVSTAGFQSLSFPIYNMGVTIVPASWGVWGLTTMIHSTVPRIVPCLEKELNKCEQYRGLFRKFPS